MTAIERKKMEWIKGAPTFVLDRIVSTSQAPENQEPSPQFPLGGFVHISGVGTLKLSVIRAELKRRTETSV